MEDRVEESFIKDTKRAIFGSINGIILYDVFWPYFALILMQLVLQSRYESLVDTNYYTMSLVLMIITSLFTLLASVFIASPKILVKAYNKIKSSDWKLVLTCIAIMFVFSYFYNFLLLIFGVDINGGNANQNIIVDLIKENAVLAFLTTVIIAPISEEITYRYFLYGGISKYNRKWAIIISGFIFMCVHATASFTQGTDNIVRELLLLPPYMFSGMVLAYSYDKSSNLAVSTSIHVLNNLFSFILCLI